MPCGISLSYMLPTVGQEASPVVVSLSPHLADTQSSEMSHCSRGRSDAHCRKSFAAREALATVMMSPVPSMPKPSTGLPVFLIPSTMRLVQPSSMPMTTTAATLGLAPVPIRVRKKTSRSSPNCSRPYAWGKAIVPLMLLATDSHAAFDRSSSGRMTTWLRTPTRPFSRRQPWKLPFALPFCCAMAHTLLTRCRWVELHKPRKRGVNRAALQDAGLTTPFRTFLGHRISDHNWSIGEALAKALGLAFAICISQEMNAAFAGRVIFAFL